MYLDYLLNFSFYHSFYEGKKIHYSQLIVEKYN